MRLQGSPSRRLADDPATKKKHNRRVGGTAGEVAEYIMLLLKAVYS